MNEENISLFSQKNPIGGILLQSADLNRAKICTTKGQKNLRVELQGRMRSIHSTAGPREEAIRWFSTLDLTNKEVLYIFGIGLGYYYNAAAEWLHETKERRLVFLEDDLAVIHYFLESENSHQFLQDPQVDLYYFQTLEDQSVFDQITWKFCGKQIEVSALNAYRRTRSEFYTLLKSKILYESSMKNDLTTEFFQGGIPFFKNFYLNFLELPKAFNAQKMFGKFQGIPALVCGAGPSLKKNLKQLKTLADRALIFAGGSAMNAVNEAHFLPHFGAGIDPNPDQYLRYAANQAFEVPFFYRNRLEHRALMTIHGPRIYVKGDAGYPIADWMDQALGIEGADIEEGRNVVNFCAEIAAALGCNPIIFVGLDLAYSEMKSYAKGVVSATAVKKEDLIKASRFELDAQVQKNIYGKPVYTVWKWIAEANWIADFAKRHPTTELLNASEGGIGIDGVQNFLLEELLDTRLQKSWNLYDKVFVEIQNAAMHISSQKIITLLELIDKSLMNCLEHLKVFMEKSDLGSQALAEIELQEEEAYQVILSNFERIYRNFRPEDPEGCHQFLMQTAHLNLRLIREALSGDLSL